MRLLVGNLVVVLRVTPFSDRTLSTNRWKAGSTRASLGSRKKIAIFA